MRVSIIIAAHQEGDRLWRTVQSCVETTAVLDREIIVADDASDDGSLDEVSRRWPHVRIARHDSRKGASPAKAFGARQACGEVLVFLDGHVKPEIGAVQRLVEGVGIFEGKAVITPAIAALDCQKWRNDASQIGHGYSLNLADFSCGWLALSRLRPVRKGRRQFYESPALIGCALAVSRQLYEALWGFDAGMRFWGVEDLDFGLKCWLMGYSIMLDPEAVVGHRFRATFDNFSAPVEHIIANQRRMARKNFMRSTEAEWVDRCRQRYAGPLKDHPVGLFAYAHELFLANQASAEEERAYLLGHRVYDEFWYAERNGLDWPRIASSFVAGSPRALQPDPSPSPSAPPCDVIGVTPETTTICIGVAQRFTAQGTNLKSVKWTTGGAGTPATGAGASFSTKFNNPGTYTVTATCGNSSAKATVTVVSIAFSVNPVRTGMTATLPNNRCNIQNIVIATPVVVTVTPASAVNDVSISIGGKPEATITNTQVNAQFGTITVTLTGKAMTPVNKPGGDSFLQAKVDGKACAQVPIIVVVPFRVAPRSAGPTVVNGRNMNLTACTSPAYTGSLAAGFVYLASIYGITQSIPVNDQFGAPLDVMYDGAPVFEKVGAGGSWFPINVTVNGGSYPDPVGKIFNPGNPKVGAQSDRAMAWPGAAPVPAQVGPPEVQNIFIQIAGVTLQFGVTNRTVIVVPGPGNASATVTIAWQ